MRYRNRVLTLLLLSAALALPASFADAQVVAPPVVTYRVTRTASGQATNLFTFAKATATCNALASAIPAGPVASWEDPENTGRICFLAAPGNWANLPAGIVWTFTLAAAGADGIWSPESAPTSTGRPNAPTGFGIRPTFSGVALLGTIEQRFPFAGLDVVRLALDDTGDPFHLGAMSMTIPGFSPRPGDRVQVAIFRP